MSIAAPTVRVELQFTAGVWSEVANSDVQRPGQIRIRYGIDGNSPVNVVASPGECQFVMRNDVRNSGGVLGYYSPVHASKRSGWTFGIPCQVVFSHPSDTATTVTITRSSQTATVAHTTHGKATGDYVTISGANQAEYNGTWRITVTGANAYTYTVAGSPATPATGTITSRKAYVKHRGKVRVIDPDPNPKGPRGVRVTSYDGMRDLAETDLREVDLLTGASEETCFTELLDALPTESQPVLRDIDGGVDSFGYVFDDLGSGVKALGVIYDVALSSPYTLVYMKGDGTFTTQSRGTRTLATSSATFTDSMHGLSVPTDLGNIYNHIRVTIQRRTPGEFATEELYSLPEEAAIAIPVSSSVEVWTDYTDPNDRQTKIGGTEVVTTLVAGTHYQAFDAPTGGTDVTADVSATVEPFSATAKWTLTNSSGTVVAFVRVLKVIGRALRNLGPETYQASSVQTYGTRSLEITPRYLSDGSVAQAWANLLEDQYNALEDQVGELTIIANHSTTFMTQALAREPGDIITISESLTGYSSVLAVIHSVEIEVNEGKMLTCRWGLAPAPQFPDPWELDVDSLGVTTALGF